MHTICKYERNNNMDNERTRDVVEEFNRLSGNYVDRYEQSEYQSSDLCMDALASPENMMIAKIDRDRQEIRTEEQVLFRDIEEDLRNRFTGIRLIEQLEKLDEARRRYNSGGVR